MNSTPYPSRIVFEAIGLLHKLGHGRLKIYSYLKEGLPSRRFLLFAADRLPRFMNDAKRYPNIFGVIGGGSPIMQGDTPEEAAQDFIARHTDFLEQARGEDPVYVQWYAEMLQLTAPDGLLEMESSNRAEIHGHGIQTLTPPIYPAQW